MEGRDKRLISYLILWGLPSSRSFRAACLAAMVPQPVQRSRREKGWYRRGKSASHLPRRKNSICPDTRVGNFISTRRPRCGRRERFRSFASSDINNLGDHRLYLPGRGFFCFLARAASACAELSSITRSLYRQRCGDLSSRPARSPTEDVVMSPSIRAHFKLGADTSPAWTNPRAGKFTTKPAHQSRDRPN